MDNGRLRHELHFATPTASAQQYIESIRPHEEALIVFLGRLEEGEGYGMKELERHFLKLSWTAVGKKALDVALHAAWRLAHKRGLSWFALRMAVRSYPAALDRIPAKGGTVGPCPEDLLS